MTVDVFGRPVEYIDEGQGQTVLFLHGWAAEISIYRRIFDWLIERSYRVVAFNMPGVGATPEPAQPMTVKDYLDLTLEFCRALDISDAVLIGHSHGGRIMLPMLADALCPVAVKRAVMIDCTGAPPQASQRARSSQQLYKVAKALGTWRGTKWLFGGVYERARDKRASPDYKAASPVMRETMKNILPADFRGIMPQITAEVLLIWGENDTATPISSAKDMERLIPGAGLALVKNAGHFPFSDNWGQFSAILAAFL